MVSNRKPIFSLGEVFEKAADLMIEIPEKSTINGITALGTLEYWIRIEIMTIVRRESLQCSKKLRKN